MVACIGITNDNIQNALSPVRSRRFTARQNLIATRSQLRSYSAAYGCREIRERQKKVTGGVKSAQSCATLRNGPVGDGWWMMDVPHTRNKNLTLNNLE
jgi:hypothetical protein